MTSLDKSNTAKGGWGSLLAVLGAQGSATGGLLGGLQGEPGGTQVGEMQDPRIYTALQDGLETGEFTAADQAFFAAASPARLLSRIHVPVLLMQGTDDTLFTLHEAIANDEALKRNGIPVQMLWFCGSLSDNPGVAHGQCLTPKGPDPALTLHFELRWLARYLRQDPSVDTGPAFTWISDAGTEHTAATYPPSRGAPVTGTGSGTLPLVPGDASGALIAAAPAANAVNVPLHTPAAGTQLLGEPTLTLDYSGTATSADGRLYAQLVSTTNGLVLGNQVTPIPVTLDGHPHTLTIPLEAVAADAGPSSGYTLQITDGTTVYFAARAAGAVTLSKISVSVPTVAAGAARVVSTPTPTGPGPSAPGARRFSCAAPTGRIARRSLGPLSLGMTRARARRAFPKVSTRGRRNMDFFCPTNGFIRVGYGRQGRVVLALTGNVHFTIRGVRHGTRLSVARRRLRLTRFHVGRNYWYLAPDGARPGGPQGSGRDRARGRHRLPEPDRRPALGGQVPAQLPAGRLTARPARPGRVAGARTSHPRGGAAGEEPCFERGTASARRPAANDGARAPRLGAEPVARRGVLKVGAALLGDEMVELAVHRVPLEIV